MTNVVRSSELGGVEGEDLLVCRSFICPPPILEVSSFVSTPGTPPGAGSFPSHDHHHDTTPLDLRAVPRTKTQVGTVCGPETGTETEPQFQCLSSVPVLSR